MPQWYYAFIFLFWYYQDLDKINIYFLTKMKVRKKLNVHRVLNNQVIFTKLSKIHPLNQALLTNIRNNTTKPRLKTIENIALGYKEITGKDETLENIMIWLYEPIK